MLPTRLPYAPLSDLEVVQRVLAGEKQLYELLLRRHNQRLYRVGLALLHDTEAVEEAMQVTWVRAYEQLASFAGRAEFITWLTRILLNECLGRLRQQQRNAATASLDEYAADLPSAADATTPLELVLNGELREALEHAVQTLPEAYRSVFVLRAVEGLSVGETAEYLGLTETNVKARLSRARERLRHLLLSYDPQRTFTYLGGRCDAMVQRVWHALS